MKIAEILLPTKLGEKPVIRFVKHVSFKCIRCGTFCCHLGSPEFNDDDWKVLQKKFGNDLQDYIEKREIKTRQEEYLLPYGFKSVNGSECIFLKRDKKGKSGCEIYNIRPLLCRTFPFVFQQNGDKIEISVIPCPGLKVGKQRKKERSVK